MNIKWYYDTPEARAQIWCMNSELTDNGDGTWSFPTTPNGLGTGSEIIVMNVPGLVLFYDAATDKAYDWTTGGN